MIDEETELAAAGLSFGLDEDVEMTMDESDAEFIERALAEQAAAEERAKVSAAVEAFDLQDFISSMERRSVTVRLYARGDFDREVSVLKAEGLEHLQAGRTLLFKQNRERLTELVAEYHRQSIDITLEEWTKAEQAVELKKIRAAGVEGDAMQTLHLIAAQISDPSELRGDGATLEQFAKVIPSQVRALVRAWGELQELEQAGSVPGF